MVCHVTVSLDVAQSTGKVCIQLAAPVPEFPQTILGSVEVASGDSRHRTG